MCTKDAPTACLVHGEESCQVVDCKQQTGTGRRALLILLAHACLVAAASQLQWENRFLGANGSRCLIAVDGTDFIVQEPHPFEPGWCSHKFHHAGVRHEVGISIQSGDIVWLNGPFPCGAFADQVIALQEGLEDAMEPGERHLADGVHQWLPHSETPNGLNNCDQHVKKVARARHETVNGRFKNCGALRQLHRHDRCKHGLVMSAIVNITQIELEEESPLFPIHYDDSYDVA